MQRKRPLCGALYDTPSALSRTCNKALIYSSCGIKQALDAAGVKTDVQEKIIKVVKNSCLEP